jgi:hypothetical protein
MSTELHISLGTRLTSKTGKGVCRVGAIAFDESGQLLGLSARHVLECEEAPDLFDALTGEKVGDRISMPTEELHRSPFFNSIGLFKIDRQRVQVRMATPFISVRGLAQPDYLLGAAVFKLEASSALPRGTVTGLGGAVGFVNPYTNCRTIMTDVIELRFADGGTDPSAAGEAGSLLVDERDAAVGLIICGQRGRCFAAPLAPFLRARKLTLAGDRAPIAFGAEQELASYVSELRFATSGGRRMRDDLLSEPRLHADPSGDEVPPDLLRYLEAT